MIGLDAALLLCLATGLAAFACGFKLAERLWQPLVAQAQPPVRPEQVEPITWTRIEGVVHTRIDDVEYMIDTFRVGVYEGDLKLSTAVRSDGAGAMPYSAYERFSHAYEASRLRARAPNATIAMLEKVP